MTDKDDIYRIFCFIPTDNSKKIFLHWSEVNSSVLKTESYFFDPFDLKGKSTGTFNFARGSRIAKNIRQKYNGISYGLLVLYKIWDTITVGSYPKVGFSITKLSSNFP